MALVLVFMAATLLLSLLVSLVLLWLGGRLVRAPNASFRRAALVMLAAWVVGILLLAATRVLASSLPRDNVGALLMLEGSMLIAQILIVSQIIRLTFETTNGRAFLVWLIATIPSVLLTFALVYSLKAVMLDAYVVPTNSMAPTIIGWHRNDACPLCQQTLIVPASDPDDPFLAHLEREELCICQSCRKMSKLKTPLKSPVLAPDRVLVNKLVKPERWDLVAFRPPPAALPEADGQSMLWIARLVGFPGESVLIKDGALFINDVRADVPAHLTGLRYSTDLDHFAAMKGSPENPLHLGPNEYAVFGDHTELSNDSRFWGVLPGDQIESVAVGCYWPMNRWRVFRW